jgi:putative ABC transport system permease protein
MPDLRYTLRTLAKAPGFTAVAVLTLALCIGANSAIFSVLHAILLKPYPWPGSERLVYIHNTYPLIGLQRAGCSIPDYLDRRNGVTALAESALITGASLNLASDGAPERVSGVSVTPSLFPLLQTSAAIGRTFTEEEAAIGATKTVVLSDTLWRNRFGSDPKIIGTTVRLNREPYTIIGVMPRGFYFPSPQAQLWIPFAFTDQQKSDSGRGNEFSGMVARLKPGATIAQAQREVTAIHVANAERLPQSKPFWTTSGFGGIVVNYLEENVKDVKAMLWLVQAGVAAALLIGCANVASLLLARASARERELAIRAALGAGRARLMRQLLTESVVLFLVGGLLGLGIALAGVKAMSLLGVGNLPRGFAVSLDLSVFGFTMLCALVTGLVFGALPAWSATRGNTASALKDAGTRATTGRRHLWLRSSLVVTEIALALMLLATAALLLKSFSRLQEVSPGFVRENVLTAQLALPSAKYDTPEKQIAFHDQVLERVRALPGVTSAGFTSNLPFSGSNNQGSYQIDGYTLAPGQPQPHGMIRSVSPDFFKTLGVSLLRGRVFADQDTLATEGVVVIDRFLAERYWPGEDPIGKRIIRGSVPNTNPRQPRRWTIIGVVAPVKNSSIEAPVTKETIYFSALQVPQRQWTLVAKTAAAPASPALNRAEGLTASLRAAILAVDPEQPVFDLKTMEARLDEAMQGRRSPMILLGIFAGIALLLAALGVYGVLAFAVGQRTPEIGIRLALGATRANILGLILRQGAGLVALGVVLGLAGYFALSAVISKILFGVGATDPATLVIAPITLALVAIAACLIPARRATKVDPMVALRAE